MIPEITLIVNRHGRPLAPTRRTRFVRDKIRKNRAIPIGRLHNGIRVVKLLEKKYDNRIVTDTFGIGIDPGYQNIGYCLYKIRNRKLTALFMGEVILDTPNVTKRMKERAMYRRNRRRCRRKNGIRKLGRYRVKFRHPRWKNRRSSRKYTPTVLYVINRHVNLVKRFTKWLPISIVSIETAKFDIHKLQNPSIYDWQYQKGRMSGFSHVREYVLYRDNHRCVRCGQGNIPLAVHHIVKRSEGGTNNPDNLVTLCTECHTEVHANNIRLHPRHRSYKDSSVLNTAMGEIVSQLKEITSDVRETTGADTKSTRIEFGMTKSHANDAACIVANTVDNVEIDGTIYPYVIQEVSVRRHPSRNRTYAIQDRRYYEENNTRMVAKNRRKRTDQRDPSLVDYLKKHRSHPNLRVKPGKRVMRVDWTKKRPRVFGKLTIPWFLGKHALIEYVNDNGKSEYGVIRTFYSTRNRIELYTDEIRISQFKRVVKYGGFVSLY